MCKSQLIVTLGYRWWFWPYINTFIFLCVATGYRPTDDEIDGVVWFAIKHGTWFTCA